MSEKILIAEIADNVTWYDFRAFYANVWGVNTINEYDTWIDADFAPELIGLDNDLSVLSVTVRLEPYAKVDAIADVITTERTFYYNVDTHLLLIHFADHRPYYYFKNFDIELGFTLGFYYTNSETAGQFNNMLYRPRLLPFALEKDTIDDIYEQKQVYTSAQIEIDNADYALFPFSIGATVTSKIGNYVRLLVWSGESAASAAYADFTLNFQGVVSRIVEGKTLRITADDVRTTLKIKSPSRYLDNANFPDIGDAEKTYIKPALWGDCFRVPVQCLNEKVNEGLNPLSPTSDTVYDFTFMLCDTADYLIKTDAVTAVYIDGVLQDITAPSVSFDTEENIAYITLDEALFRDTRINDSGTPTDVAWRNMGKVSIDVSGYLPNADTRGSDGTTGGVDTSVPIRSALFVMREIIKSVMGIEYSSASFDITTWDSYEGSGDDYDIGYYINEPKTAQELLEEIAQSVLGRFFIDANRRFSFSTYDFVSYADTFTANDFIGFDFVPEYTIDPTNVIAKHRTGYRREWDNKDNYSWYVSSESEEEARAIYNATKEKDFTTLISGDADAEAYSNRLLPFISRSVDTFSITLPWDAVSLSAGDWVQVDTDLDSVSQIGSAKCLVMAVKPDPDRWAVTLDLRIFETTDPDADTVLTNAGGDMLTDASGDVLTPA